ncbi:MAG: DNA polymerase III subunit beta [Deltaproteobacteria bacterium]|nr:MAG: DNA polymerase III subunit beta [Deltaproteobacteria bacterium]
MHIIISTNELLKSVQIVQSIAQKRNTIPVLSNILIEVQSNYLRLQSSDLDIDLQILKSCEVFSTGVITVNAKAFSDVVKFLPGEFVTLQLLENGYLQIKSGKTLANLITLYSEDYPLFPDIDETFFKNVRIKKLLDAMQKAVHFTSTEVSRYSMTGVYVEPGTLKNSLVSTDGHRLSKYETEINEIFPLLKMPILLPRKGLQELLKILEQCIDHERFCMFGLTDTMAVLKIDDTTLCMKLMELAFPEYEKIIPEKSRNFFISSRVNLINSLKRVSVLASDKNQGVKFRLNCNGLQVSCFNPNLGEICDDLAVIYSGPEIESSFVVAYVIDALSLLSDLNVMISFEDEKSPVVLTGELEKHHICVVMPIYY